jgi:hypothetical protein
MVALRSASSTTNSPLDATDGAGGSPGPFSEAATVAAQEVETVVCDGTPAPPAGCVTVTGAEGAAGAAVAGEGDTAVGVVSSA